MTGQILYRLTAVLLGFLLVVSAAAPVTAGSTHASSDDATIHRTLSLSLTPETPGEIATTASYEIPSSVRSLDVTLPPESTVTGTRGFTKEEPRQYEWDGTTSNPEIQFTVAANKSVPGLRAHPDTVGNRPAAGGFLRSTQEEAYSFVDTGPWAIVAVPRLATGWRYVGDRPSFEKTVEIDGEGITGGEIAYLGPHRTIERTAHGQTFTLVVPAAAEPAAAPDEVLDAITSASDTLRVGDRDEHVFMVAAPTTVAWRAAGIEYGGSDFWVKASERLDDPRNVWLHEYVHTRQHYDATSETQWTMEAGAEYYAALLALQQGRISFASFSRHLERGTREPIAATVLSDPDTWSAGTPYLKGALVFGAVDHQLRLDSNQTSSMQTVFSRMNAEPDQVTESELFSFVGSAGTSETRRFIERYADTSDHPDVWTRDAHDVAFATRPSRVSYRLVDIRVSGPQRDMPLGPKSVVTTDETVTATVNVSNTGGTDGPYEAVMYVDDQPVVTRNGTIDAASSKTVKLVHRFGEPGSYPVTIAGETTRIVVEEPAEPRVSELAVDASQDDGAWTATITVTITNPASRPASGTVPVTLDGKEIANLSVSLPPNASTSRTVRTNISPGTHTIAAGGTSTTLDVPSSPSTGPIPVPGFGPVVAGIAILLAAFATRLLH